MAGFVPGDSGGPATDSHRLPCLERSIPEPLVRIGPRPYGRLFHSLLISEPKCVVESESQAPGEFQEVTGEECQNGTIFVDGVMLWLFRIH
jgi:hypothetical protein